MTTDVLHNAIHDRISERIAENYESPAGCMPDRLNPSAVATIATPAALAAIEEQGKAVVDVSDLVAAITVLATADDTCADAACWREACQLLVRLRAALPGVALEPPGTLQGEQATGPGISGRSDDQRSAETLSGLRERIVAATYDSEDACPRCKSCDRQHDAVMAVVADFLAPTPITEEKP